MGVVKAMMMDYLFYRIYRHNLNKGDDMPISAGVFYMVFLYCTMVFFFGTIFNFTTGGLFAKEQMTKGTFWFIYGGIIVLLLAFNFLRYAVKGRVKSLERKFENDRRNNFLRVWHIMLLPFLVLIFSGVVIYIFAN